MDRIRNTARPQGRHGCGSPHRHRFSRVAGLIGVFFTLAFTLTAGCDRQKKTPATSPRTSASISFAAIESPSMAFLPRQEEIPGWRLVEDPLVYPGDRLASYIDTDAAHFRKYDVLDLTIGEYTRVDGTGVATVEIFRFPDFVKAFGAFSTRRNPHGVPLNLPNESFAAANSIHVWRGPFYYRILGAGKVNLAEPLKQLAAGIAVDMPVAPARPAVFNFFPEANRVRNSEVYSADGAFGQPFLAHSFTARFRAPSGEVDGLILPAPTKEAATKIIQQYENFFRINGRLLDPVPNLGEGNFTAEDRFVGRAVAFRLDRFVIAFRGFGPRQELVDLAIATDQRLLGTIRRQLEAADEAQEAAQRARRNP